MAKIEDFIMSLGGHQYRRCYRDLCWAIYIELEHLPDSAQMKFIAAEICQRNKRCSHKSVWRSLARAVEDLWESGDLEAIYAIHGRWRTCRPKPQEFIYVVACRIRDEGIRNG